MSHLNFRRVLAFLAVALATAVAPAAADERSPPGNQPVMPGAPRPPGSEMPANYNPPILQEARAAAGIDEKTGQKLPPDLVFTDGLGATVRLGDYFDGQRPVIIQLAYYKCPKLCGEISKGMVRSMKSLAEELKISDDFQVITISFDSRETPALAAANKEAVVEVLGRTVSKEAVSEGWDMLVGDDANIKPLADALGYRFGWIEEVQQYSHPAAVVVVAPDGRISRYLYGTSYDPMTLRLSLVDASQGTISPSLKDVFILNCFDYDPAIGKYTATAYTLMRIAGATTVIVMASVIGFLLIAERRGKLRRMANAGTSIEEYEEQQRKGPPPPRTAFS